MGFTLFAVGPNDSRPAQTSIPSPNRVLRRYCRVKRQGVHISVCVSLILDFTLRTSV